MPYGGRGRYDLPMQAMHWLIAVLIVAAFVAIQVAEGLPRGPERVAMMGLHKSLGATILELVLIRMSWRLARRAPSLPASVSPTMELAAKLGHLALYALMAAVPLGGILASQANGREVGVWGLVTLPALVGVDKALAHDLGEVHEVAGMLLIVLAGLHAAVALYHQIVLKDGLMARMSPWAGR